MLLFVKSSRTNVTLYSKSAKSTTSRERAGIDSGLNTRISPSGFDVLLANMQKRTIWNLWIAISCGGIFDEKFLDL